MQIIRNAVPAVVGLGTAAVITVKRLIDRAGRYAPYEDPLLEAIHTLKNGGTIAHETSPVKEFHEGEVLTSADGKELGIAEMTENSITVLAKDLSAFQETRSWYRTGIRSDDITWSVLWGLAERRQKTKEQRK